MGYSRYSYTPRSLGEALGGALQATGQQLLPYLEQRRREQQQQQQYAASQAESARRYNIEQKRLMNALKFNQQQSRLSGERADTRLDLERDRVNTQNLRYMGEQGFDTSGVFNAPQFQRPPKAATSLSQVLAQAYQSGDTNKVEDILALLQRQAEVKKVSTQGRIPESQSIPVVAQKATQALSKAALDYDRRQREIDLNAAIFGKVDTEDVSQAQQPVDTSGIIGSYRPRAVELGGPEGGSLFDQMVSPSAPTYRPEENWGLRQYGDRWNTLSSKVKQQLYNKYGK